MSSPPHHKEVSEALDRYAKAMSTRPGRAPAPSHEKCMEAAIAPLLEENARLREQNEIMADWQKARDTRAYEPRPASRRLEGCQLPPTRKTIGFVE